MTENLDSDRQDVGAVPAFTTRPRRLLLIGRMEPGREGEILEAHERLPYTAAAAAGIDALEAFVGSGHYALLLEINGDDAQEALAAFLNDADVRDFYGSLQPLVSGLPVPGWTYQAFDEFHDDAARGADATSAADSGPTYSSADLPLAASMYRWRGDRHDSA